MYVLYHMYIYIYILYILYIYYLLYIYEYSEAPYDGQIDLELQHLWFKIRK